MPIPNAEGQLYMATGIDNTGLIKGKAEALGIISSMASQISKKDVFAGLAIGATVAFAKVSKEMKQFSEDFEHSMKEVQTISAAVKADFDGFSDKIVGMSTGVPQTANELSEAFYQIVSAGYDGVEGMELLQVAAEGAVGGVSDVMTVADGYTTAMNAWKISTAESTKVSDIFFNTVKRGKTTISELSSNIAQVAPLAAPYKVGMEQIFAATATLTKQGTPTAQAMTQIRSALIGVNEVLGEGWSATMTFQEALVEVDRQAKETGTDLKEFIGGRVEGVLGVLAMTGENAKMAAEDLRSYADAVGESGEAFNTMMEDSINQSAVLGNNIKAALKPLGDYLAGKSTEFAKNLNEAFESGQIKEFAKYLAIATTALAAYKLTANGAALTTTMLKKATVSASLAMKGLNTAFKANPIGMVAIGITAAVTALNAYNKASDKVGQVTGRLSEEIGNDIYSLNSLFEALKKAKTGTDEWNTARDTINSRYGKYLDNLIDEKTKLEDIETAQKKVTEAMIANAGVKVYSEQLDQQLGKLQKKFEKTMGSFTEAFSEFKGADRLPEFIMAINEGIDQAIKEGGGKIERGMLEYSQIATGIYNEFMDDISQTTGYIRWDPEKFTKGFLDLAEFKAKEADFTTYLQGMIESFQQIVTGFSLAGGEDDEDGGGITPFDLDSFKDDLDEAKEAFAKWEEFKNTSYAADLQGEYQSYLDLGATYEEYLAKKLEAYKGNKEAVALILKELATLELAAMEKAKNEAKDFRDLYLDIAKDISDEFVEMFEDSWEKSEKAETKALTDREEKYIAAEKRLADIALQYASRKEIHELRLKELDDLYKTLGKKDEEYYRLRRLMIWEFLKLETSDLLSQAGESFRILSGITSDFNEELSETFDTLSEISDSVFRAVEAYGEGNYAVMILSIVDALYTLGEAFAPDEHIPYKETEEWKTTWEAINAEIETTNRLLSEQYDLLNDLVGSAWYSSAYDLIAEYEKNMQDKLGKMQDFEYWVEPKWNWETSSMDPGYKDSFAGWSVDAIQNYIDNNPMYEFKEEVQELINEYRESEDLGASLADTINQRLTGTTADAITNTLVDAFANGEAAAENFATTFEDLMKQAIINSFETKYLEAQMSGWYDTFVSLSEDGLSKTDIMVLQKAFNAITENAGEMWDAMTASYGDLFFGSTDDANSLSGAIRSELTEETGSLLAGRMNTMMLDLRVVAEYMVRVSDTLDKISFNTSYNRRLVNIESHLGSIDRALAG